MGITFRHDFASLAGAFGASNSANQSRGRKYAMDRMAKQRRAAQPLAIEQPEGQWSDPLAITQQRDENGLASPEDRQAAVTARAQQKARARKYRLGEDVPGAWQPQFTPQSEIDDAAAKADEAWGFHVKGIDAQIPVVPEHLAGTEWESDLKKINEAERKARGDRSLSEDQRNEAITKIQEQRDSLLKGAPPASSEGEKLNENLWFQRPDGTVSKERGEGDLPGRIRNGEFEELPQSIAQKEQAKEAAAAQAKAAQEAAAAQEKVAAAQAKAEADRQKARDAIQDRMDKLDDEIAELEDDEEKEHPKTVAAKRARREALEKKLGEIGAPAPAAPSQPSAPAVLPSSPVPAQGVAPAVPSAMPPVVAPPPTPPAVAPQADMLANRDAPAIAPAPPARKFGGSRQFGQPIQNYQPANDAERNMMAKGYARVPILNAKGQQTGQYSWTPAGQSPDMLANRNAPVNAPLPTADTLTSDMLANRDATVSAPKPPPPQLTAQQIEVRDIFGIPHDYVDVDEEAPANAVAGAAATPKPTPYKSPTKPVAGAKTRKSKPAATSASHQQYGMSDDTPPEVLDEAVWLEQMLAAKGPPSNWTDAERARYQQARPHLHRYNMSNQ